VPSRHGLEPAGPTAEQDSRAARPGSPRATSGRHTGVPDTARPETARPDTVRPDAGSGPYAAVRTEREPQTDRGPQTTESRPSRGKRPADSNRPATGKRPARGKRPASVKLAISVALLLVLAAAATLGYTVLHARAKPIAATTGQSKVTPSASPSASLGQYGHIGSRQSDPQPLTIAQLFPASFTIGGQPVTRVATAISRHCAAALSGSNIKSAVGSAHCDQAVRATYLARSQNLMGAVGVLNLNTAVRAAKAVKAADASDYINQLKGKRGPARKIGNGTGIEEALAKGHYLILIWAEFTSLRKPKTTAQRTEVVNFMTELLQHTANVSLATRMLSGNP
jgi:hypothetical protein